MASEAKQYAARNRQGSNWFNHESSAPTSPTVQKNENADAPSPTSPAKDGQPVTTERPQMIKPSSDSNSWYKYESAELKQAESKPDETSPSIDAKAFEPTFSSDAASNQQKNKAGSAGEWFSHDHTDSAAFSAPHHGASRELGANAARMRGESENWFSHDQRGQTSVTSSTRGRTNRPADNGGMHDIFHHADSTSK